ncbi:MAG: hypothetical protein KDD62_03170 [Bdellovibrionales bacterium]|nr:hypothetical protein [Bdellovibrionales bacterium]
MIGLIVLRLILLIPLACETNYSTSMEQLKNAQAKRQIVLQLRKSQKAMELLQEQVNDSGLEQWMEELKEPLFLVTLNLRRGDSAALFRAEILLGKSRIEIDRLQGLLRYGELFAAPKIMSNSSPEDGLSSMASSYNHG